MPVVIWVSTMVQISPQRRSISMITLCLLTGVCFASVLGFQYQKNVPVNPVLLCLLSPFLHADYLHLFLNVLGGYLVFSKLEELVGGIWMLFVVAVAYTTHALVLAFLMFFRHLSIDILGISTLIFASIGYIYKHTYSSQTTVARVLFVVLLFLMLLIEQSIRTNLVHVLALALGYILSTINERIASRTTVQV
jgi:membrane associated rhomboid family serine protease